MRITTLSLAALLGAGLAGPALSQPAPVPSDPAAPDGTDAGGAGYLPGAQFQRRLDGGAGFVCSATNALNTARCTASCRRGEVADCTDADGAGAPSCTCSKG